MDNFDRAFNRASNFIVGWFIFCGLAAVAGVGFVVWLIFKLLGHFGVL